jgi:hypothetical protein
MKMNIILNHVSESTCFTPTGESETKLLALAPLKLAHVGAGSTNFDRNGIPASQERRARACSAFLLPGEPTSRNLLGIFARASCVCWDL